MMRLFKRGVSDSGPTRLPPLARVNGAAFATAAPADPGSAYRLSEVQAVELAKLARELEARPDPDGPLAWAVARFEMGCERESALEGLSDHLLALRGCSMARGRSAPPSRCVPRR